MNKLILGRYFPGDSWIHRLDPRAKLLACIYFILVLFLANNWQTYVLLWLFTLFVMYLSGVSIRTYIRGVKPLIWLILFTVFLQVLFTSGGTVYFEWGPITITYFGLTNGFFIFCRFVMIVFISTVVTLTTKPIDLTDGINSLLRPLRVLKVPVDEFSLMLSISLRFIPNLLDETQKIMDAQRARGTEFGEGNLFQANENISPDFSSIIRKFIKPFRGIGQCHGSKRLSIRGKKIYISKIKLEGTRYHLFNLDAHLNDWTRLFAS